MFAFTTAGSSLRATQVSVGIFGIGMESVWLLCRNSFTQKPEPSLLFAILQRHLSASARLRASTTSSQTAHVLENPPVEGNTSSSAASAEVSITTTSGAIMRAPGKAAENKFFQR